MKDNINFNRVEDVTLPAPGSPEAQHVINAMMSAIIGTIAFQAITDALGDDNKKPNARKRRKERRKLKKMNRLQSEKSNG